MSYINVIYGRVSLNALGRRTMSASPAIPAKAPRKRAPAKPTTWSEYSQVETPAERVKYLQSCHDFLLDPTATTPTQHERSTLTPESMFDLQRVSLPHYDMLRKHIGYVCVDAVAPTTTTTTYQGDGHDMAVAHTSRTPTVTITTDRPIMNVPVYTPGVSLTCSFCKVLLSPPESLCIYTHPTAPRSLATCCTTCFVDPGH